MIFKGYKIKVRCVDWEQEEYLGNFWDFVSKNTGYDNLYGLGMNWTSDNLYFDYALGTINLNSDILDKLESINFNDSKYNVEYIEIDLPNKNFWSTYNGKEDDLKSIYETQIDCYNRRYDYELEHIDGFGNIEISIHYL